MEKILHSVNGVEYYPFDEHNDNIIITPSEAKANSVIVFDDVACEKQDNIRAFSSMGRHKDVDCFYLSQTYAHIPKYIAKGCGEKTHRTRSPYYVD